MGADDTTGGTACDTPCQNSEETVREERKECSENNTPLTPVVQDTAADIDEANKDILTSAPNNDALNQQETQISTEKQQQALKGVDSEHKENNQSEEVALSEQTVEAVIENTEISVNNSNADNNHQSLVIADCVVDAILGAALADKNPAGDNIPDVISCTNLKTEDSMEHEKENGVDNDSVVIPAQNDDNIEKKESNADVTNEDGWVLCEADAKENVDEVDNIDRKEQVEVAPCATSAKTVIDQDQPSEEKDITEVKLEDEKASNLDLKAEEEVVIEDDGKGKSEMTENSQEEKVKEIKKDEKVVEIIKEEEIKQVEHQKEDIPQMTIKKEEEVKIEETETKQTENTIEISIKEEKLSISSHQTIDVDTKTDTKVESVINGMVTSMESESSFENIEIAAHGEKKETSDDNPTISNPPEVPPKASHDFEVVSPIAAKRKSKSDKQEKQVEKSKRDSYQETKQEIQESLSFIKSKLNESPDVPYADTDTTNENMKLSGNDQEMGTTVGRKTSNESSNPDYEPIEVDDPDPVYESVQESSPSLKESCKDKPAEKVEIINKPDLSKRQFATECIPPMRPARTKKQQMMEVPDWRPPEQNIFTYLCGCFRF